MTENWKEQALGKLQEKGGSFDKYASAMKEPVRKKLESFCAQDEEFAQAVAQGGAFADCMKKVAGAVKNNAIEDLVAYQEAVSFYFPGALIRCEMTIDLVGEAREPEKSTELAEDRKPRRERISLDLNDFL